MYTFLLILLILDSILLITVVLMQAGQGGGLAALGGGAPTETFFGGRQAVTILTKLSWWCGGIFLGLSLLLAGLSTRSGQARSILQERLGPPPQEQGAPLPIQETPVPGLPGSDTGR